MIRLRRIRTGMTAEQVARRLYPPRPMVRTVFDSTRPSYALPVERNARRVNGWRADEVRRANEERERG